MKNLLRFGALAAIAQFGTIDLEAHCQMPCGIYHDDMVYDQIDQYVETMYKGISVLNNSEFNTVKERNEFVRWVICKERASDEAASLILTYFLQQKIKAGEENSAKRVASAHKLLHLLVAIKQHVSLDLIKEFSEEWESFKLMFHREGYECAMEKKRMKEEQAKREEQQKKIEAQKKNSQQSSMEGAANGQ